MLTLTSQTIVGADPLDDKVERLRIHARIDWHQASAPLGRILLIRNANDICAVRFTEFHRGHDAKPPTVFNSGAESLYAEYDWYCQVDGSGDFKKENITRGHGKLVERPLRGIGRLAFQAGKVKVKCGPFKLFWFYPTSISFSSSPSCDDSHVELAPTKWKEIEEVVASDSKLKWYRCDEHRESIYIPIDEL